MKNNQIILFSLLGFLLTSAPALRASADPSPSPSPSPSTSPSPSPSPSPSTWWPPVDTFQIQESTSNGLLQQGGSSAPIQGTVTWIGAPSDTSGSAWGTWLNQNHDGQNLNDLLTQDGLELHFYFPDMTTEVTSNVITTVTHNQITFQYSTPLLNDSDLNAFTAIVYHKDQKVLNWQIQVAKLNVNILTWQAEIAVDEAKIKPPVTEITYLQNRIAAAQNTIASLQAKILTNTETVAQEQLALQVDNQIAAATSNSSIVFPFRYTVTFDLGSAIQGEDTTAHGSVIRLSNDSNDPTPMTTRKWTPEFFWNGNLVSSFTLQTVPIGGSVTFDYPIESLQITDPNRFTIVMQNKADTAKLGQEWPVNWWQNFNWNSYLGGALTLNLPVVQETATPLWTISGPAQGQSNQSLQVSALIQDSFGLIDPSTIDVVATGTLLDGTSITSDITSQLNVASPDEGQSYQVSGIPSLLANGTYTISFSGANFAGEVATASSAPFLLSSVATWTIVSAPSSGQYIQSLQLLSATLQSSFGLMDPDTIDVLLTGSLPDGTSATNDITSQLTISSPDGGVTYQISGIPTQVADGDYTISFYGENDSGGSATASSGPFIIDSTLPQITLSQSGASCTGSPVANFNVTVYDLSPISNSVSNNGRPVLQNSAAPSTFGISQTDTYPTQISLAPGLNNISVTSTDVEGNTSTVPGPQILYDNTAPVIAIGTSDNVYTNNATLSIPIKVTDSGAVTTQVSQNGSVIQTSNLSNFTVMATLSSGTNAFQFQTTNCAGLTSTAQLNSITLDNTLPILALGGPQNVYTRNPAFSLPVMVTDALATTTTVYLNGSQVAQSQQNSFVASMALQPGTNSIQVVSTDIAGNTVTAGLGTVDFDNIAPVITLGQPDNQFTRSISFPLPITVLDSLPTTTSVLLNGVQVGQYPFVSFTASLRLQQGFNVIQVNSIDEAGNQTSAQLSDIYLNTIPPAVSSLSPSAGTVINTLSFPVSGIASEPLRSVTLNGQAIKIAANQLSFSGNYTASASGPLNLNWVLTDLEGNITTQTVGIEVLLNVLNGNLLSVAPDPDGVHLDITGSAGAAVPGISVSASASLFNNGSATANANGSFVIQMLPFQTATVTASANGVQNTATVTYGPGSGTFLAGTVKNTQGNPIAGVTVSIIGTGASTTTDGNGVFAFNASNTTLPDGSLMVISGDRTLLINGTTSIQNGVPQNSSSPFLYSMTEVSINIGLSQSNVISTPIYLQGTPNDGSVPVISASSGGFVTSSAAPGVSLSIPANSATFPGVSSAPVYAATVSAAVSTIPPLGFSSPNHVTILEPSGTHFSTPVQLTLPNVNHLAPGVQMVIMSMNSTQGIWQIDGVAAVSADGQSVVTKPGQGITHFSVVYASPVGPTVSPVGAQDQPGADSFNGSVSTTLSLPSFKSLGNTITPGLVYKSSWAKPSVLVTNQFNIPRNEIDQTIPGTTPIVNVSTSTETSTWFQPDHITAQFSSGTLQYPAATFTGVPNQAVLSYSMDLRDPNTGSFYSSGVYPYDSHYQVYLDDMVVGTITAKIASGGLAGTQIYQQNFSQSQELAQIFPSDMVGQIFVQNQSAAPEGKGWRITGPQRITNPTSSQLLLEEADGTISGYDANNTITTLFDPSTLAPAENVDLTQGVDFNSWPNAGVTINNGPKAVSIGTVNLSAQSPSLQNMTRISFQQGYVNGFVTGSSTCTVYKFPVWWAPKTSQLLTLPGIGTYIGASNVGTIFKSSNGQPPVFNTQNPLTYANPYSLIFANDLQTVEGWFEAGDGNPSAFSNYLNYPTTPGPGVFIPWQYEQLSGQYVDPNPTGSVSVSGGAFSYSGNYYEYPEYCSGVMQPGTTASQLGISYGWNAYPYILSQYLPQEPNAFGTETPGQNGWAKTVPANLVSYGSPMGVMPGPRSNTFVVADHSSNQVDLIDVSANTATVVAGNGTNYDVGTGYATTQSIYHPRGVAYDVLGNLYISSDSGAIRMVDTTGQLTFITQPSANSVFSNSSPAINAQFKMPTGLAVDNLNGYLYVADTGNNRVVQINLQTFVANTIAGNGSATFSGDNGPALAASLNGPTWLGLDSNNNLLIDDAGNQKIRRIIFNSNTTGGVLAYASTHHDNSTLTHNADGTFTRTLRNGNQSFFDVNGHQIAMADRTGRQSTFAYDAQGRMISATDPVGQVVQYNYFGNNLGTIIDPAGKMTGFTYDSANNLTQVTFPDGSSKHYTYDLNGLMLSETDQSARTTQYAYNQWGRIQQATKPDGSTISFQDMGSATAANNYVGGAQGTLASLGTGSNQIYDGIVDARSVQSTFIPDTGGFITAVIDGNGNTTSIKRDQYGNPLLVTRPDGTTVTFVYDANTLDLISQSDTATGITTSQAYDQYGHIVASTNGRGYTSTYRLDPNTGTLTATVDPLGHGMNYIYNGLGLPVSAKDSLGIGATVTYDSRGNPATVTNSGGHTTTRVFDASGNLTSLTNADGQTTAYSYDAFNRLLSVTSAKGEITQYSYLPTGELAQVKDPLGNTVSFLFSPLGQVIQKTDALGFVTKRSYDGNGNLLQEIDPNGNVKTFTYDNINRLIQKTLPDDSIALAYDVRNNLLQLTNSVSSLSFSYDNASRMIASQAQGLGPLSGTPSTHLSYTWDADNNRVQMVDPIGVTNYSFDQADRPISITNPFGENYAFVMDAGNRLTSATRPGSQTVIGYDSSSLVASIVHSSGGTTIATYALQHDNIGNLTQVTTQSYTRMLGYDSDNQLTTASNPESSVASMQAESFSYDARSNRTQDQGGAYGYDSHSVRLFQDYRYTYVYDNNGNLISKQEVGSGVGTDGLVGEVTNYTYSSQNQLTGFKVYPTGSTSSSPSKAVNYFYDGLGRRISKQVVINATQNTVTRNYAYDGSKILLEYDGSNNLLARYTHRNGGDGAMAVAVTSAGVNAGLAQSQGTYLYLKDQIGSTIDITDSNGNRIQHYVYSAFGERLQIVNGVGADVTASPPIRTSYEFAGREHDWESGLMYMRARYYDPSSGRFLQQDPSAGALMSPISVINPYVYAANSPSNLTDSSGMSFFGDLFGWIADPFEFTAGLVASAVGGWVNVIESRVFQQIAVTALIVAVAVCIAVFAPEGEPAYIAIAEGAAAGAVIDAAAYTVGGWGPWWQGAIMGAITGALAAYSATESDASWVSDEEADGAGAGTDAASSGTQVAGSDQDLINKEEYTHDLNYQRSLDDPGPVQMDDPATHPYNYQPKGTPPGTIHQLIYTGAA